MKARLLALGLALSATPLFSQDINHSVFAKFHDLQPVPRAEKALLQAKVKQHFPGFYVSYDKLTGNFSDVFGTTMNLQGNDFVAKTQACFNQHLSDLGLPLQDWHLIRNNASPKAHYVAYQQYLNGHKVAFSQIQFRFVKTGELTRVKMRSYGSQTNNLIPAISHQDALNAAIADLGSATISSQQIVGDWVWFPVPSAGGYQLRPAYAFSIEGEQKNGLPILLKGYVDALNGEVLYRNNEVKETVDVIVKGRVFAQNPLLPTSDELLANLAITIGSSNYNTDSVGFLEVPSLTAPITATVKMQGKWCKVNTGSSSGPTPSVNYLINTNGTTYLVDTSSTLTDRHVNAYYHVNRVHDFMKSYFTSFTGMDFTLTTNVEIPINIPMQQYCNAYYSPGNQSFNFYAPGGGCNSFANVGDVVYHEYGHGISDKFYDAQSSQPMINGALNEGNSDIWGISITHDPVLGKGTTPSSGSYIRRYDQAPKVYPQDIVGEVHADGEIIAGAWWDVALNIGSADTMTQLFTDVYYDTPDGPNGTEGTVYYDVLVSALENDDDDNQLNNGTPHFSQITTAFAKHGIYLLGDASLTHSEADNQIAGVPVTVNAGLSIGNPTFFQDLKLFYRNRTNNPSQWDSLNMTDLGGLQFTGQIPGQPYGTIVDYYFGVYDYLNYPNKFFPGGFNKTTPPINVSIPYQYASGIKEIQVNPFEDSLLMAGWQIGNVAGDAATGGKWICAVPVGSFVNSSTGAIPVQPGADHTTGTGKCLVTGNAASTSSSVGNSDVDGGKTTVLTPAFDLSGFTEPIIEYYRWYTNDQGSNPGNDEWQVQIKPTTSILWKYIERTLKSDHGWRRRIFNVNEFFPGATQIQMQFIASDQSGSSLSSIVEAAVDDFIIYDKYDNTGVGNVPVKKSMLYPNPADDAVLIKLGQPGNGFIGLYDVTGKEIKTIAAVNNKSEYTLSTRDIPAGTYLVTIQLGKSIQTIKLVISH